MIGSLVRRRWKSIAKDGVLISRLIGLALESPLLSADRERFIVNKFVSSFRTDTVLNLCYGRNIRRPTGARSDPPPPITIFLELHHTCIVIYMFTRASA